MHGVSMSVCVCMSYEQNYNAWKENLEYINQSLSTPFVGLALLFSRL